MKDSNKLLDVHAMLLELKKQGYEVNELIKDCENNDPRIAAANTSYSNKRYGKHLTWAKEQINKTGLFKELGGQATLLFKILVDQAIEGTCEVKVSLTELQEQTGLSINTIKKSLKLCQDYALIVLIQKGIGSAESVYRLNPELVQIGKTTKQHLRALITSFYKLTGTTYEYENSILRTYKSAAHKRFEEVAKDYAKTHKRAMKSYIDENGNVRYAGAFVTQEEYKELQKKVPNEDKSLDTDETDSPEPFN